LKAHIRFPISD